MQREAVRNVRLKLETFLASLDGLEDEPLIKAIRLVYPQRVSEAEPVDVTKNKP